MSTPALTDFQSAWDFLHDNGGDSTELWQIICNISKRISREFQYIMDAEDLQQEWCVHLSQFPHHARHWVTKDPETGKPKFGHVSFKRDAAGIMAKAARAEKARTIGYEPDDEYFYTKNQIIALLPYVFADPVLVSKATQDPEQRSAAPDHSKGGNHLAGVMDVRHAWKKTITAGSQWDRVMRMLFQLDATLAEVGEKEGVSTTTVAKIRDRAIDGMVEILGGKRPGVKEDGPGSRRAMSNAESISRTEHQ